MGAGRPVLAGGEIGRPMPRRRARRLAHGRGQYTDDLVLARMLHVAFVRSPYAHAGIGGIDVAEAGAQPGVVRVITGSDLVGVCAPMVSVHGARRGHKSAPQPVMAIEAVYWQGEAVAAVVAETRAGAEDAAGLVAVDWRERPVVHDAAAALAPGSPVIHPALGDNLAYAHTVEAGTPETAFDTAHTVPEPGLRLRTPHRGHSGAAQPGRRLSALRRVADGLSVPPVAVPDAGSLRPAPGHGRPQDPRDLPRRGRRVRPEDQRPRRGGGHGRDRQAAGAAGQVHRRPAGILRQRHPHPRPYRYGPHRRHRRGRHHRDGDRRPVGDRTVHRPYPLWHRRGDDGDRQHRRALPVRPLSRPDARGLCQQVDRGHVSRGWACRSPAW